MSRPPEPLITGHEPIIGQPVIKGVGMSIVFECSCEKKPTLLLMGTVGNGGVQCHECEVIWLITRAALLPDGRCQVTLLPRRPEKQ